MIRAGAGTGNRPGLFTPVCNEQSRTQEGPAAARSTAQKPAAGNRTAETKPTERKNSTPPAAAQKPIPGGEAGGITTARRRSGFGPKGR